MSRREYRFSYPKFKRFINTEIIRNSPWLTILPPFKRAPEIHFAKAPSYRNLSISETSPNNQPMWMARVPYVGSRRVPNAKWKKKRGACGIGSWEMIFRRSWSRPSAKLPSFAHGINRPRYALAKCTTWEAIWAAVFVDRTRSWIA